ncbi:carboxymuconolactone decarboxylase family protein [Paucihalobacter sp.]|uniref:carboxymuconolactone decarboxylase family protein n=1 Tax=Paucihalobacter sp. TaxID=2850405 RepID=UPI003D160FBE
MTTTKLNLDDIQLSEHSEKILDTTKKAMGFVPNMYKTMAGNTSLLDSYTYAYNSFRKHSGFTPVEQEVVFLSVSYVNNCTYCMAAHSFVGDNMTNVPTEVTDALREGKAISDNKLNALSSFTKIMVETRGLPSEDDIAAFFEAGYSETHVLAVIAGMAVKTMSNYSNHNTHPELDDTFAGRKWQK